MREANIQAIRQAANEETPEVTTEVHGNSVSVFVNGVEVAQLFVRSVSSSSESVDEVDIFAGGFSHFIDGEVRVITSVATGPSLGR